MYYIYMYLLYYVILCVMLVYIYALELDVTPVSGIAWGRSSSPSGTGTRRQIATRRAARPRARAAPRDRGMVA